MNRKNAADRIEYIDALRTISCFAVVMLHVTALNTYYVEFGSHEWNIFMGFESAVNWAVPVFVMISGALMLSRAYTCREIRQKLLKLIRVYAAWSCFYLLSDICLNGYRGYMENSLWLQVLLQGHYHMWYLIMLCGLYLVTPFLSEIVKKKGLLKLFLLLSLFFAFALPSFRDLIQNYGGRILQFSPAGAAYRAFGNILEDLHFYMALGYAGYYAAGYWLVWKNRFEKRRAVLFGCGFFLLGVLVIFTEIRAAGSKESASMFLQYYQIGILMQACGIVLFIKHLAGTRAVRLLAGMSSLSFGIYMLHPFVIEVLQKIGITSLGFSPLLSVPVLSLLCFFAAAGISAFIQSFGLSKWIML